MAMSLVKNRDDAEDIVQEGAYKAIRSATKLKNTEFAATYVYRIMLNEAYKFLSEKKHVSIDEEEFLEPATFDTYEDTDLKKALDAMDVKDRTVIVLKYFEDMKLEEISNILDENLSTVKSRLYRGLKKLRLEIGEE
ncbi:MAG: sigma-70 family RNA polymerase sigma factor [Lachnospiraceae bacterium]|nr:sigma-70 family RNA polymerase sigma factor [Lachnospiraceae bacterium]